MINVNVMLASTQFFQSIQHGTKISYLLHVFFGHIHYDHVQCSECNLSNNILCQNPNLELTTKIKARKGACRNYNPKVTFTFLGV
jgi:hypothetical protein